MPDFTCVLASIFVFLGNLLLAIWAGIEKSRPTFEWGLYKSLDPTFLQEHWFDRNDLIGLHMAGSFIVAISWILLIIPVLQAAFILSNGGRRQLWLHSMMAVLAVSAGTTEFVARLMHVGSWNTANWINKDFYLDDWGGSEGNPNGIGWKSLEITYQLSQGQILWVDGWEYFALFGILTLNLFSVRGSRVGPLGEEMCWAGMGFFIGCLSLVDFIFLFLRFAKWDTFNLVSILMTILIRLVLLPSWLMLLAFKLPGAVQEFAERRATVPGMNGSALSSPKSQDPLAGAPSSPSSPSPGDFSIED